MLIDVPKDVQQSLAVPDWDAPMELDSYISRMPGAPGLGQLAEVVGAIKRVRVVVRSRGSVALKAIAVSCRCQTGGCSAGVARATHRRILARVSRPFLSLVALTRVLIDFHRSFAHSFFASSPHPVRFSARSRKSRCSMWAVVARTLRKSCVSLSSSLASL